MSAETPITAGEIKLYSAAPKMYAALQTIGLVLSQRKKLLSRDDELFAAYSRVIRAVFEANPLSPSPNSEGSDRPE